MSPAANRPRHATAARGIPWLCVLLSLGSSVACRFEREGTQFVVDSGGRLDGPTADGLIAQTDGARADVAHPADAGDVAVVPVAADGPAKPDGPEGADGPPVDGPPDSTPPPSCLPGDRRCATDQRPEICSAAGVWVPAAPCPYLCVGKGICTVCMPGAVTCSGAVRRRCRDDASGHDEMACSAPPGGTAYCREGTCGFDCTDIKRRFKCDRACCECLKHADCPANNVCTAGACKYQPPVIRITGGYYGRNCQGMGFPASPPDARPDRTAHLALACDGKTSCDYDVDHTVIGDPAVACPKIYEASWLCLSGATRTMHTRILPAEASYGPLLNIACAP